MTLDRTFFTKLDRYVSAFPESMGIRQILVNLAVQGKLTQQDANEKVWPSLEPLAEELPDGLVIPPNWKFSSLRNLGKIYNGSSLSDAEKKALEKNKIGIPYLGTKDIGYATKEINYENGWLVPFENEKYKRAPQGTLLICLEGGSAGKKMGIVDREVCFGNKMFAIQLNPGVHAEYLQLVYQSTFFQNSFADGVNGIIAGISKAKFEVIACPIPPLEEQLRTVKVFEELLSEFNLGSNAFKQSKQILAQSRNSFINEIVNESYGVEFKLKVAHLLQRIPQYVDDLDGISQIRRCLIDLVVRGAFSQDFTEVNGISAERWELPKNWKWVPIKSVIDPDRGISYGIIKLGKEPKLPGVPVLRCSDVKYRGFDLTGMRTVEQSISDQYTRTVLRGGEVLVNIRGTLGGCAIVPQEFKGFNIAREVAVMQPSEISAEFLLATLSSNYFTQHVLNSLRGISYKGMNLSLLGNTLIPLPPKDEEIRLVGILQDVMQFCDDLEMAVKNKLKQADALEAALRSELVQSA